jgi:hypothetical protein
MTLREVAYRAAGRANAAAIDAIADYRERILPREEDVTAAFIRQLGHNFNRRRFAGLQWSARILNRGPGTANEEGKVGADMLLHVALDTPTIKYSKGVLIQAKRKGRGVPLSSTEHDGLVEQCRKMEAVTSSAWVANYTREDMRFTSAHVVEKSQERVLSNLTVWTSHRFFLELFRCPIGDPRIASAKFDDLPGVKILGEGEIDAPDDESDEY